MYQDVITVLALVGKQQHKSKNVGQVQHERFKDMVDDNSVGSNDQLSGSFIVAIRAWINYEQRKRSKQFEEM